MLSDRISILTNGQFNKQLSVQQILQCFKPESACSGNSPEEALIWLEKTGYKLDLASSFKYRQYENLDVDTFCRPSRSGVTVKRGSVKSVSKWIEEKNPDPKILRENIMNMKLELLNHGTIFSAMTVYRDFYSYDGRSVYEHERDSEMIGGHAIEIIGYCDKDVDTRTNIIGSNLGYWICRNSWGTNWPIHSDSKGFFIIRMGTNECGIESRNGCADVTISGRLSENVRYTLYKDFISDKNRKTSYI
jgi:hypothetical protein